MCLRISFLVINEGLRRRNIKQMDKLLSNKKSCSWRATLFYQLN